MFKKSFYVVLLTLTFVFSLNAKVVNVGYFKDAGTFMSGLSEETPKYGYAYDYLQTIATYTGWTYNYKYGYFQELYDALLAGEIDLLVDISYTPERAERILFSDYPMATENYYLYSNEFNVDISADNFSSLNGKTIALGKGTYQYDLLQKWLTENDVNLDMKIIPYDKVSVDDFNNGLYDLYLSIDLVSNFNWEPIAKIGSSEIYAAVNINRTDILEELNAAQSALYSSFPYYNNDLWIDFFSSSARSKQLTAKEHQWIYQHQLLDVGCLKQDKMFCSVDPFTGEVRGLVPFMMERMTNIFELPNQKFIYHYYNSMEEIDKALEDGEIDFAFPMISDFEAAEIRNQSLTQKVVNNSLLFIYSVSDFNMLDIVNKKTIIAVPKDCRTGEFIVRKNIIQNADYVYYQNHEACLNALLAKEVDAAVFPSNNASALLHEKKKFKKLYSTEIHNKAAFSYVAKRENVEIISILNKLIANIPASELEFKLLNESIITEKTSIKKIVADYFFVIMSILLLLAILVLGLALSLGHLRMLINYDVLTHLLNRRSLPGYMKNAFAKAKNNGEIFSIMIFDLDDFKKINDNYGHAIGDEILKIAADTISKGIKRADSAFRWGGEEFLVLLKADKDVAKSVAERIRNELNRQTFYYEGEKIKITTTVGISSYMDGISENELFAMADKNLYKGKNSGKNQVVW